MKSTAPFDGSTNMSIATAFAKQDVLGLDPPLHLPVDALQVQVRDASVMVAHELNRVSSAIRVVADIEADPDPLVRVGKQALDLRLVLDMCLGVRVGGRP